MQVYGRTQEGARVKGYLISQEVMSCVDPAPKPWTTIAIPKKNVAIDWGFLRPFVLVPVDPDSIQYCSGMLDANGNEVASGDIVQSGVFFGLVEYRAAENGTMEFAVSWYKDASAPISVQRLSDVWIGYGRVTIIGSIWETPKLLPKQKEGC